MRKLAISYNINIIGGSHPTRTDDGEIQNVVYVFLCDGSVHPREKIHPTPNERHWWAIQGGDVASTILAQGTVQNLRDRRFDLYRTVWTGK